MKQFEAARRASVPLVIWKSPDAAATISAVVGVAKYPVFSWDIARGIRPCNEPARSFNITEENCGIGNPPGMLTTAQDLPPDSVMFMHNAHLFASDGSGGSNSAVVQGIWNLRDTNKADHRTLIMLASQMQIPSELVNDVMVIDEALPNESQLSEIVDRLVQQAKIGAKDGGVKFQDVGAADRAKAVDALSGLSAYAAEQSVAVSFEKQNGKGIVLNLDTLWERKRQTIEETRGLTVWRDGETLDDVKGCENVKRFARKIIAGKRSPRAIVFIDEIEKTGVANTGDLSGTNNDQLGYFLSHMQNTKAQGFIAVGPPGCAKSMLAKAFGNTAKVPTIQFDMGAMKAGIVGESERHFRTALKVVDAVSQGRALYIATCNDIQSLPPALIRRFTLGIFYFDLLTLVEREACWKYYIKKFGLKNTGFVENGSGGYTLPFDDVGWTGSDIYNCANRAWMFDETLAEAARYATPVCKTDPAGIERLRKLADGAFLSANYEGLYRIGKDTVKVQERKMRFD